MLRDELDDDFVLPDEDAPENVQLSVDFNAPVTEKQLRRKQLRKVITNGSRSLHGDEASNGDSQWLEQDSASTTQDSLVSDVAISPQPDKTGCQTWVLLRDEPKVSIQRKKTEILLNLKSSEVGLAEMLMRTKEVMEKTWSKCSQHRDKLKIAIAYDQGIVLLCFFFFLQRENVLFLGFKVFK